MNFYERRLLNADTVEVRSALSDPLGGLVTTNDVTLELSNADLFFNGQDLRGIIVDITRFDREDAESATEFSGRIVEQTIKDDRAILRLVSQDQDALQTLIPRRTATRALFPNIHAEQGLGKAVPVVFGNAVGPFPLPFVNDDTGSNTYDYLIGEGTGFTSITLYRDTVGGTLGIVPASEYTINTTAYSGFTVARFPLRQVKFGGGLHTIFAVVNGLSTERNFASAIQTILTDATWGLGLTVDASSFATAVAAMNAIGSVFCDGVLFEQRPAIDVLNQMLSVRGMTLTKSSGSWVLTVDSTVSSIVYVATFGHGDGQPWRNVSQFDGLAQTPVAQAVSTLYLDYAKDWQTGKPRLAVSRSVLSIGRERRITNDFLATGTGADKTVDYLAKRLVYADQSAQFISGQDARFVAINDKIKYNAPQLGLSNHTFRVTELSRKLEKTALTVEGWDQAIYNYVPGTVPADITPPSDTDYSKTAPTAASALSIAGSGTERNSAGQDVAYILLQYSVPSEAWATSIVQHKKTADSVWSSLPGSDTSGTQQTKISALVTLIAYDYRVVRRNTLNTGLETASTTLANQTTPYDTTAPAAPTGLVATAHPGSIDLDWTDNAEPDLSEYGVWRHTANVPGSATEIAQVRASKFIDPSPVAGTLYYYWISAYDSSENQSAKSTVASATATIAPSGTAPSNPSAPTLSSSGTYLAGDGHAVAYAILNTPAMPSGASYFNILYRINGQTVWQIADQTVTGSSTSRVDDLVPGQTYQFAVQAFSGGGGASAITTMVATLVAPGDTTAPGAPTALTQVDKHLKTITFSWTKPADTDVAKYHWEIRTSASGGGSLVVEGDSEGPGQSTTITLNQIAYSTTRYLRVRAHDFSGNIGSYSASLSFSFAQVVTGDIGSGQVGGTEIGTGAVATGNVAANAITARGYYSNDGAQSVGDTEIEIGTLTLGTDGGYVEVHGKADCLADAAGGAGGDSTRMILRLRKDSLTGTILDQGRVGVFAAPNVDAEIVSTAALIGYDATPSASQTYKLTAQRVLGSGTCSTTYRRLYPGNNKK